MMPTQVKLVLDYFVISPRHSNLKCNLTCHDSNDSNDNGRLTVSLTQLIRSNIDSINNICYLKIIARRSMGFG